jgi:hypothetical protein
MPLLEHAPPRWKLRTAKWQPVLRASACATAPWVSLEKRIRDTFRERRSQAPRQEEEWVLARTSIQARLLENSLRREMASLDQDVVIWLGPYDVPEFLASGGPYGSVRNEALVLLVFACMALVLAALRLFTVSAYSVSHRIQEFGIRIAVGAATNDILSLVLNKGCLR